MKFTVGVIGLGYWGPNYIRNFIRNQQTDVTWGCDFKDTALKDIYKTYPGLKLTKDHRELLNDPALACVAIATPPETHFEIAKAALSANKHVFVAKPLTMGSTQAVHLLKLAEKKKLLLHGDLTYLYTGAVRLIKDRIAKEEIGKPLYYDSTRSNLGLIQKDVNVIWDLAIHDLAIIDYCFGLKPLKVSVVASKHFGNSKTEELAHITINYVNDFIAHIQVSWISPVKLRTILIGGSKKMIFFNDVEPDEKVKIYDKGIESTGKTTPFKPAYRSGDVVIPKIDNEEALYLETKDIINQISSKNLSYSNAKLNIKIIHILEACDESLRKDKLISLKYIE